jgi:hypothetical protein
MKYETELFSVTVVIFFRFCHLLIGTHINHRPLSIDGYRCIVMILLIPDCLVSWMSGWFIAAFEVVIIFGGAVKLERKTLHCLC